MDQFVVWTLRGVTYLCLRPDPRELFLTALKRLPNQGLK